MLNTGGFLIQWNGGMEWNGVNAASKLILNSTSHLVTMITLKCGKYSCMIEWETSTIIIRKETKFHTQLQSPCEFEVG